MDFLVGTYPQLCQVYKVSQIVSLVTDIWHSAVQSEDMFLPSGSWLHLFIQHKGLIELST